MTTGPEFLEVEQPLIEQLVSMGWRHTTGSVDHPSVTDRENFRQVLLIDDLRRALVRINKNDESEEWLDDARVSQAVSALQRHGAPKLMEANREGTERLLSGVTVPGVEGWDGGRDRTVHYIDWEDPENNTFRVINQFKVDEPGGQVKKCIIPDAVLFVNGIPLVVIECKSPYSAAPMEEAIDQLQRYSNQRTWVEENEGNEKLFHTNQFVVATCYEEARAGTIGASAVHYLEWKDTSPVPMSDIAAALGKESLSSQEKIVAGMLRPEHLLDIVQHFTLFAESGGKVIKLVPRYQQFRAVRLAVDRLLTGKSRRQDGEHDRRGGIIWHTQGSGKSLSMVFLVRKMRTDPLLRRFKVVVVTDRKTLQKQLSETAELTGETVKVATTKAKMKEILSEKGPGLVFAMIQKYHEKEADFEGDEEGAWDEGVPDSSEELGEFPVLNEDESILVLVDEAHRSHASALHANLMRALPNCARIGFTGTPIIMGAKKRTHEIFGEFIDRYTIKQSEDDGSTVPILYEGRTVEGAVKDGHDLDQLFEDLFRDRTPEELEKIKQKYGTKGHVMEAPELIASKARDMLRHYVENVLPNGFKAQVVAVSRRATIRYREAFLDARRELVARLEALEPGLMGLDDEAIEKLTREEQYLARARRYLDTIREIDFAPVISGSHNDDPAWSKWTEKGKIDARITRFKKPLFNDDPEKRDPLAFLIVKSMLITGFDAPLEQGMYLDRPIKEAELLQAIARVNRTYPKKSAGIVVDYYGVARHLKEALAAYSAEDVEGALQSLKDEIPKLRDRHRRVIDFFRVHGIEDLGDQEACISLLEDEKLRARFQYLLKQFLVTLDLVIPRPEALPYLKDAKALGHIQLLARNRYRDGGRPIGRDVGEKVRRLIDDHIVSLGIDPKIPPISILDASFDEHVAREGSDRARASEMEHAIRSHIRRYIDEDPEHYQRLSERLESILAELEGNWEELVRSLRGLIAEAREGRKGDDTGLDPETQAPFLGVLKQEIAGDGDLSDEQIRDLLPVVVDLVDHIRQEVQVVDFLKNPHAQEVLRNWIFQFLDDHDLLPFERLGRAADRILELTRANHGKLVR